MMRWFLYAVAAWMALGAMVTVAYVGRPRGPITSGAAVFSVVINAVIVTGLVLAAMAAS